MAELIGKTITKIRKLTKAEREREGWDRAAIALELDDGTILYASRDDEGNGPGTLFGTRKDGTQFYVMPKSNAV